MIILGGMDLITPDPGLFIWTVLVFIILWVVLGKFAFKPIAKALRERENSIDDALKAADKARGEMATLQSDHAKLLNEAREERGKMLKQAKETKESIINEAKDQAKSVAAKIIEETKREIDNQKMAAITEVKNQVGTMALEIAEKVLKKELQNKQDQEGYVKGLVEDIRLN
jgi:F-type H+-transporting ATPase subunit b